MTTGKSTNPSLLNAMALQKGRKGPATEADRPKVQGKPPRVLPGQVDLFGRIHGTDDTVEP